ncbi:MAG: VOC family protein [Gammaproteobacteria bacterium]
MKLHGNVLRLLRISRTVSDLTKLAAFYIKALGFTNQNETVSKDTAWAKLMGSPGVRANSIILQLGMQELELIAFDPPGQSYPSFSHSSDFWFQHCAIVVDDMQAAYTRLLRHGGATAISRGGPQILPPSSGSVTAFKFRDPDGHPLELIAFPAGSGDPVWQKHAAGPSLGIDHSAISVASPKRSIAFYNEVLGFALSGQQTNRGPQQANLDALPDVEVEVIALQSAEATTPHVELLGYRTPRGRALPDLGNCDIAADRLVMQVQNLSVLLDKLPDASTGPVTISVMADVHAALLCDPDGHRLLLIE